MAFNHYSRNGTDNDSGNGRRSKQQRYDDARDDDRYSRSRNHGRHRYDDSYHRRPAYASRDDEVTHSSRRDRNRSRSPFRAEKDGRDKGEPQHHDSSKFNSDGFRVRNSKSKSGPNTHGDTRPTEHGNSGRNGHSGYSASRKATTMEKDRRAGVKDGQNVSSATESARNRYVTLPSWPLSRAASCQFRIDTACNSDTKTETAAAAQPEYDDVIEEVDEDAVIEARRKHRAEIKARLAMQIGSASTPATPDVQTPQTDIPTPREAHFGQFTPHVHMPYVLTSKLAPSLETSPTSPAEISTPGSAAFLLVQPPTVPEGADAHLAATPGSNENAPEGGVEDGDERYRRLEALAAKDTVDSPSSSQDDQDPNDQGIPSQDGSSKDVDMFADDDDDSDMDMFADPPEKQGKQGKPTKPTRSRKLAASEMQDDWDDAEGFYKTIQREQLNDRYDVLEPIGKGMFASVVRALDEHTGNLVAIKITRNNDMMKKAGQREIRALTKVNNFETDLHAKFLQEHPNATHKPESTHVIRMLGSFTHKKHLCIVFESMQRNMRDNLKKFGLGKGLEIKNVRYYCYQMFRGLRLLKECDLLHTDLKPDNILAGTDGFPLKIADLGSSIHVADAEITAEIASRFYRPPEVIIGIKAGFPLDMWSMACTLFELFSGDFLFPGDSNCHMLKLIQECRGKISKKVLRRGQPDMISEFFDDHLESFLDVTHLPGGRVDMKHIAFSSTAVVGRDIKGRLLAANNKKKIAAGAVAAEHGELMQFADLLDKCLKLDPDERFTPGQALNHPFLKPLFDNHNNVKDKNLNLDAEERSKKSYAKPFLKPSFVSRNSNKKPFKK
jgi:serine/threonine-protein kinase PRP4